MTGRHGALPSVTGPLLERPPGSSIEAMPAPDATTPSRSRPRVTPWAVASAGAVICALGLWQTWGVVLWILGIILLGAGLMHLMPTTATRRLVAAGSVLVAVVPFALPHLTPQVPVSWSVPDEEALTATEDIVVTVGDGGADLDDGTTMLRGRTAETGDLVWEQDVHADLYEDPAAWVHEGAEVAVVRVETRSGRSWELHARDMTSGEELWTVPATGSTYLVATSSQTLVLERGGHADRVRCPFRSAAVVPAHGPLATGAGGTTGRLGAARGGLRRRTASGGGGRGLR